MKERIKLSGNTVREEMIHDGQNLLVEELEHDSSYSPTVYFYNPVLGKDDKQARLRIYNRKFSSLNGNYQNFLTTYDNPVKIGEYIHDTKDDTYWLIYNSFDVNGIHYEGKMIQCNYLLKWQLSTGEIIERWANIVSASKYDVGEKHNNTLALSSNNYTILIGYCEEGFELEGKRVFIDMKPSNPTKVFKITRSDDVIYNSSGIGYILSFIADKTEFNFETDNQELRICDYTEMNNSIPHSTPSPPSNPDEITDLTAVITGNINLKNGFSRTYTVTFADQNGNELDLNSINFNWNVESDFDVNQTVVDNEIELLVNDENCIGSSFLLSVIINNMVLTQIEITVVEGW